MQLSAAVVCQDEQARIAACLESLAFADEIVAVDGGSRDRTREIAAGFGARVVESPFVGMNAQKERARRECSGTWVLVVDADERVSAALAEEIAGRLATVGPEVAAFSIPFRNHFRGRFIRRGGYYPDRHVRLFRRDRARYDTSAPVHDRLLVDGRVLALDAEIDHYSFDSFDHFLQKSVRYSSAFAAHAHAGGRRAGAATILGHAAWRFAQTYVVRGGFLEGAQGLTLSGLAAFETFQKYARLWELGHDRER